MADLPTHKNEQTGDATLDRIQGNVRDLITYVRNLRIADRLAALELASAYVSLAADTTLAGSAGVYTALLTTTITTTLASGFVNLFFTASGTHPTTANATTYFKVFVDGAFVRGAYVTNGVAGAAWCASIVARIAVTKGAHTVTIQWSTDNNSARINAVSSVSEHADMLVREAA